MYSQLRYPSLIPSHNFITVTTTATTELKHHLDVVFFFKGPFPSHIASFFFFCLYQDGRKAERDMESQERRSWRDLIFDQQRCIWILYRVYSVACVCVFVCVWGEGCQTSKLLQAHTHRALSRSNRTHLKVQTEHNNLESASVSTVTSASPRFTSAKTAGLGQNVILVLLCHACTEY